MLKIAINFVVNLNQMRFKFPGLYIVVLIFHLFSADFVMGQDWEFQKERDGIKIYTRNQESNPVKSFRGEMDLKTNMDKMRTLIGSIESFDWWDKGIKEIKVLGYEKEKFIRYYLIYDVPWPLSDRDLCVEALVTNDSLTGRRVVRATPIFGLVPENPDLVRIKNYWQQWVMEPQANGMMHVILEGSVDPGGNIPAWLINMVITDTPLNVMRNVRQQVEISATN
jgi:hypothetical protein